MATRSANIEVHGTKASLVVPDPNTFGGDVLMRGLGETQWQVVEAKAGYRTGRRGYGLAELAGGAPPRASGRLAYHVLDVMESLLASAKSGQATTVTSTCERPAVVPLTDG
ncbi:hypothetical protein [Fodinicola feengrottensis]|uniref:hypothetical protein n=1 Tax=Fodinicola feengrottensis TaxID=435914 RepID=UPI002442903F|nr:hypothetical protein [Fodinicola feengrottensis]